MPPFWGNTKSRIFDAVREADLRFPSNPWDHISESAKDLVMGMLSTDPSQWLSARQVLDHSWMKDGIQDPAEPSGNKIECCKERDLGSGSFSTQFMTRNQDISFGTGSPISNDVESPTFTCRTSFSSFLQEPSTSTGFSFCIPAESDALEFASPIPSMPSFAFFSPGSLAQGCNTVSSISISRVDAVHEEASLGRLLMMTNTTPCLQPELREVEHNSTEVKRARGAIGSKMFSIHSKRSRTIGLGEHEQLDFMVSESVIRWASCTHLPSAPSLGSSLVC